MKLHLAGEDRTPNEGSIQRLRALAAKLEIADRVVWHGFVSDMPQFYGQLDLFVLTSACEGFGRVLVEAMASGIPVIAAGAAGPLEILKPGIHGQFFEPKNHTDLANKIKELISDPQILLSMGKEARRHARRHYAVDHMVEKVAEVIELLSNSN